MLELIDDRGLLLRSDAVAAGYRDIALTRSVRAGQLARVRQGAYVLRDQWEGWGEVERHELLVHAVMRQYDVNTIAASHASAVVAWGGPDRGLDLGHVHVTSLFGTGGRHQAGIIHHKGAVRVADLTRRGGIWVTSPVRTVLDTASLVDLDTGIVVADWFLHKALTTQAELEAHRLAMDLWPNTLRLRRVVSLADGRSESVGETLCRRMFARTHLPPPELQWPVYGPNGQLAGVVDFAWPERKLMLEFDGKQKYLSLRRPGESIEDAVLREKRREDLLRELTGFAMVRLVWADLHSPDRTAARVRRAMSPQAA